MSMSCFFFKQKTAYEVRISDWSSDVCSSDLLLAVPDHQVPIGPMHHDGVVLDGGVHYVVVAALALAGEDRGEVAGRDVLQVAHPDIGELAVVVDVDRHQPRALAARRIVVIEVVADRKSVV